MGTTLLSNAELNAALAERTGESQVNYVDDVTATMALVFANRISLHWNGSEWVATGRSRTARSDNPLRAAVIVLVDETPVPA
ncbi:hypothetical protein [Carnimonas bestiolae]|uniref:hypothetical protein n=1 Tax=Carnimonas bestiolae TaxID=3402172 RepID=UPI003EDBBE18